MKSLAVIGGGIAGTTAAYLLKDSFKVSLFEKKNYFGGNNCSSNLANHPVRLPMGVIVFPGKQLFKETIGLIKEFYLETETKYSAHTVFYNNRLVHSSSMSSFKTFFQKKNLQESWYLFNGFLTEEHAEEKTVEDLIREEKLSSETVWYFLIPLASLYMSMSYEKTSQLPLSIIIYWWKKYCCPFYVNFQYSYIKGGNHKLIEALVENNKQSQFHSQHEVQQVQRSEQEGITLTVNGENLMFDKVVFAANPDSTLKFLSSPLSREKEILGGVDIGHVKSIVHQNSSYMAGDDITVRLQEQDNYTMKMIATWGANSYFNMGLEQEYYTSIMSPDLSPFEPKDILHETLFTVPLPTKKTFAALKNVDELNNNPLNSYF